MLAIIPARGGSKGLPGKNIKLLCDKPLIAYTVEAALQSDQIDRVIVSTDNQEIANIAIEYGAEVPFLRPDYLATDHAKAIDNYLYTVEKIKEQENQEIQDFIVLQPTSPLRDKDNINDAIDLFYKKKALSIIAVKESEHPPEWYKKINNHGILIDYIKNDNSLNRQDYNKTYIPNGAIYIFKYDILKKRRNYYTEKTFPYIMTEKESIDIDTIYDFMMAENILRIENDNYQ